MPNLNYIAVLAPLVEDGRKRCTIRAMRKRPIQIGHNLHHFTGLRTRYVRRLRKPDVCSVAVPLRMRWVTRGSYRSFELQMNGRKLSVSEIQELAERDGFKLLKGPHQSALEAFKAWFLPPGRDEFIGQYIEW